MQEIQASTRGPAETRRPVVSHVSPGLASPGSRAVLIDRDGVVNVQRTGHYVHTWRDFAFVPGAVDAFVALADAGLPTFVVTNQGGVGRGFLSAGSLEDIHDRMAATILGAGGRLDAIIHCPHSPTDGCPCRKPRPGMLTTLAQRFEIDLRASTFIGDNVTDLDAGRDAGCRTILVGTGEGQRSRERLNLPPFATDRVIRVQSDAVPGLIAIAPNLGTAVDAVTTWIIRGDG
jgi:D-glycero-D-manno-heptose 1,7-bisphosphate phosphatase